jgi:hypothetical protein
MVMIPSVMFSNLNGAHVITALARDLLYYLVFL